MVLYGIKYTVGLPFWESVMKRGDIANFHTFFNVVTTLFFLPFTKLLAKLATLTIPDKGDETVDTDMPVLDERLFGYPRSPSSRRAARWKRWPATPVSTTRWPSLCCTAMILRPSPR